MLQVVGISEFYAAQYITSAGKQQVQFYNCLGQKTPSACVSIPFVSCLLADYIHGCRRDQLHWGYSDFEQCQ